MRLFSSSLREPLGLDKPLARGALWRDRCVLCDDWEGVMKSGLRGLCPVCDSHLRPDPITVFFARNSSISRAFAAFRYDFPITQLHQSAKFRNDTAALRVLVYRFCEALAAFADEVDVIASVPLSRGRYLTRGFNQAYPFAADLGRVSGKPVATHDVVRIRNTPAQSLLSADARKANVQGAFAVKRGAFSGLRVGLVDDVITTGATLDAVGSVVRDQGGALDVIGFALATRP